MKEGAGFFSLLFGVFYVIGFLILGTGLWNAWRSTRPGTWPSTPATIQHLELQIKPGNECSMYQVQVRYGYRVNDREYEGTRIAFGYASGSVREPHDEIMKALQDAKAVSVRYSPRDPSVSCLSYGFHRSIVTMLVFAIVWLTFVSGMSLLFALMSGRDSVLINNLLLK